MSDYYFPNKYFKLIGFKSFEEFYEKFEYAIINNLAIDSIKICQQKSLENEVTYYICYIT